MKAAEMAAIYLDPLKIDAWPKVVILYVSV